MRERMIASGRKIDDPKIERNYVCSSACRDVWRGIRRTCVHDDDLPGQILDGIQAAGQIDLLVFHNQTNAKQIGHG